MVWTWVVLLIGFGGVQMIRIENDCYLIKRWLGMV